MSSPGGSFKNAAKNYRMIWYRIWKTVSFTTIIDDIHIRRRREKDRRIVFDLELKMEHMGEKGSLMHYNVQDALLSMKDLEKYSYCREYLYGEIYLEKKIWVHNFLLISDSEINIKCKRIEWLPEKKE